MNTDIFHFCIRVTTNKKHFDVSLDSNRYTITFMKFKDNSKIITSSFNNNNNNLFFSFFLKESNLVSSYFAANLRVDRLLFTLN